MLTEQQKEAVRFDGNLMLTACPGSGKTRVIISKLARVLDEIRDTPRSAACITYTNAGVHEIESRLRQHIQATDGARYEIGTIHSFCLNFIFRPFCYLFSGYKKGFKVLTQENEEFEKLVKAVCAQHGIHNLTFKEFDEFAQIRIDLTGQPAGSALERGVITPAIVKAYWKRIRDDGFIDFANIIYCSLLLLQKRPEILRHISAKFAWILVDEFQDTSDLQVEILKLIASQKRTKFLLVGDSFQSIFGFAGARPDLAEEFAKFIGARVNIALTGNFRSSKPIVSHANVLFPRTPPMIAVGDAQKYKEQPIWRQGTSAFQVVVDYFLPSIDQLGIPHGNAAILASTWFSLFPLGRMLRKYGVSIVGPGARPYKRTRQFAPLAEQICGYLVEPRPDLIAGIERALFNTLLDVTGRANYDLFSYDGRCVVFRLVTEAREIQENYPGGVDWLVAAAKSFGSALLDCGLLAPSEKEIFLQSVEQMKADMRANKVDLSNLTIADLGVYATPEAALKLVTLHQAKGREYDAVAMVDLHEGKMPFWQARTEEEVLESKRQFYVGVTRARRFLMYITDSSNYRNTPTRFLRPGTGVGVC